MNKYYCPRCRKKFDKDDVKLMCSDCGLQLSVYKIEKNIKRYNFIQRIRPIISIFLVVFILGGSILFVTNRSKLGEVTENGGIIFFDKLFYTNGWRYMEVSPVNLQTTSWSLSISEKAVNELSKKLGFGAHNSYMIIHRFGSDSAAYKATNYGTTEDWFLGNKIEMKILYHSLKIPSIKNGIKNAEKFYSLQNESKDTKGRHVYWVSELESKNKGYAVNFENGETLSITNTEKCFVRPIRKF